ncbi:formylglycine-generating enzyme family protein [Patescibacteria group bacterium]|nr:formylglycine-generating enzyme family protein [Patescibacteria group bacterium]
MKKQRKKYLIIFLGVLFLLLFFFIARASFQRPKNSPTDPDADKGLLFSRLNDPNLIINRKYPECPKGMRYIPEGNFCIDIYEVTCDLDGDGTCSDEEIYGADINNNSTIGDVVYKYDQYINESGVGLGDEDGSSIENAYGFYRSYSLENRVPYTNITKAQAEASCNSSGKRLPTLYEWYLASQGTKDNNGSCNQNGSVISNTGQTNCISNNGIYDMIGNVEEFTKDVLYKGSDEKYYNNGYELKDGYVDSILENGYPENIETSQNALYGNDYININDTEDKLIIIKGGKYNDSDNAGIYSINTYDNNYKSNTLGFRCVK